MDLSKLVVHPNVCRTFEAGEHSGVLFIAMEYIPGRTLSKLVLAEGCPPWARTARLLAEVASGLAEAHSQGLIHRDLKPGNVMVTPHDHAKLLDLGLALVEGETVDDPTVVGGKGYVVGTVDYMAPEQTFDATNVDARSDLYALGCTAYFALSGKVPFPGGTRQEKIQRHRTAQPVPLTELVTGLPPGLVMVVQALMAKDPDQRPASAKDVAQRLQAWAMNAPLAQVAPEEERADFTRSCGGAGGGGLLDRLQLGAVAGRRDADAGGHSAHCGAATTTTSAASAQASRWLGYDPVAADDYRRYRDGGSGGFALGDMVGAGESICGDQSMFDSTCRAMLRTICENHDDDSVRLVYADYLEEHGQLERAEFIRVQVAMARGSDPVTAAREAELLAAHGDVGGRRCRSGRGQGVAFAAGLWRRCAALWSIGWPGRRNWWRRRPSRRCSSCRGRRMRRRWRGRWNGLGCAR